MLRRKAEIVSHRKPLSSPFGIPVTRKGVPTPGWGTFRTSLPSLTPVRLPPGGRRRCLTPMFSRSPRPAGDAPGTPSAHRPAARTSSLTFRHRFRSRKQSTAGLARRWPFCISLVSALGAASLLPVAAEAQLKAEPDGRWRSIIGAGLTRATGNTDALTTNVNAQAALATETWSVSLYGSALYGRSDGVVSASRFNAGNAVTRDLFGQVFAFGTGDWLRDRIANLNRRTTVSTGLGRHLLKNPFDDWDIFAGIAYSHDEYIIPVVVDDLLRRSYGRYELKFGTESHHRPNETTTLHQRLVIYPAIDGSGTYRAVFEGGLSVSVTARLAMTATLTVNRNSAPGDGIKKNDTLFVTGLTFKLD